jgi:hypothetical protein
LEYASIEEAMAGTGMFHGKIENTKTNENTNENANNET